MYGSLMLPDIRELLDKDDKEGLAEVCNALYPGVIAEVLADLDAEEIWRVLSCCSYEKQAEIFKFLDLPKQIELVESVDRQHLSKLIEAMAPDDRVDLLERMDPDRVEDLLPLIAQAERNDIRKLLSYPEDSAGSILTTEYASLPANITVAEAIDRLRKQAPNSETIYYVYIVDDERHLVGFVSLRDLILARPTARLSDIMQRDVISVRVDDDQEHVAQELARYDFIAIPVVDHENRLVGIVTHDDVLDVVREEASEDAYRQGAIEPIEDSYLSTPLGELVWKRGLWLVLLLVAGFGSAELLSLYQDVSETYLWMVRFMPLILAAGGNSGSQSATLIVRTLALGEVGRQDTSRIVRRELISGMLLGSFLGLLGAAFAWRTESAYAAMVVCATLFTVVTLGTVNGSLLPIILNGLGLDPALMSNPLIASLSDLLGVVVYCNMAMLLLGGVT